MDALAVTIAAIVLMLAAIWWRAREAITICVIEVTRGRAKLARGGIAPRVLADIGDVVKRPRIEHATIRVVRSRDHAKVELHGAMSDAQRQQLRNVIGSVPLAKLINARR